MRSKKLAPRTRTKATAAKKSGVRKLGLSSRRAGERAVFLHAHGIDVSPAGIDRMVAAAVADLGKALYPNTPAEDLTEAERTALERGGLDLTPHDLGADDPLARTAAEYAALLRQSRTVAQTAKILGVNESRVRQRLTAKPRTLYGFKFEGEWRIPHFVFEGRRLVPGVAEIAAKLDPEVHPVGFFRWFTSPASDLVRESGEKSKPMSPRLWLLSGYSPEAVAALAADL